MASLNDRRRDEPSLEEWIVLACLYALLSFSEPKSAAVSTDNRKINNEGKKIKNLARSGFDPPASRL